MNDKLKKRIAISAGIAVLLAAVFAAMLAKSNSDLEKYRARHGDVEALGRQADLIINETRD